MQDPQPLPASHAKGLSLLCACLVVLDTGMPLAALAEVQQDHQHSLLARLKQMIGQKAVPGQGECKHVACTCGLGYVW